MLTHIPPEQAIDLILAQPAAPMNFKISVIVHFLCKAFSESLVCAEGMRRTPK